MTTITEAVLEATGNNELAARISLLIKPLRFSELDDESLQGGISSDQF